MSLLCLISYLRSTVWPLLLHITESKTVLDSGFHAVDSGFRVLDSGLFQLYLDSRISIVSGIPLYSGFQSPRFRIPYMGRPLVWLQIAWGTLPRVRSRNCSRRSSGEGSVEGSVQFNYWAYIIRDKTLQQNKLQYVQHYLGCTIDLRSYY